MCGLSKIDYNGLLIWTPGNSITEGTGDGVSSAGGCGWRGIVRDMMFASEITPTWIGTQTGGHLCATCPENGLPLAHEGHPGFTCAMIQAGLAGWLASIGGTFDVAICEGGTNDLIFDQGHGTTTAQPAFDSLATALIALKPNARFFFSNLPPSPGLFTAPLGIGFAAHVAAKVAALQLAGVKAYLIDHFGGTTPNGTVDTLTQTFGFGGQDFNGTVHPAGPGGAVVTPNTYRGYPKMAMITYLTLVGATP